MRPGKNKNYQRVYCREQKNIHIPAGSSNPVPVLVCFFAGRAVGRLPSAAWNIITGSMGGFESRTALLYGRTGIRRPDFLKPDMEI